MKNSRAKFYNVFKTYKPIIGMVHLKGNTDEEKINIAINEVNIMTKNGIDAVMIENYFGNSNNVRDILEYLRLYFEHVVYGVNILGDYFKAYELADRYGAKFIQIDSVAGHLSEDEDLVFDKNLKFLRETSETLLLGGVRFKYHPYLSGRTLEEDLNIGKERCDAIVVTGEGTGKETELVKIKKFREILGVYPLVVGAGLTVDNCFNQLSVADAGIVGSYLKHNYNDNGDVSVEHTKEFMQKVKKLRMK